MKASLTSLESSLAAEEGYCTANTRHYDALSPWTNTLDLANQPAFRQLTISIMPRDQLISWWAEVEMKLQEGSVQ